MAIRVITQGLKSKLYTDPQFELIFGQLVVPKLLMLLASTSIQDYCIVIDIIPSDIGTKISFNDGGATYDEETDEMVYTYYLDIDSEIKTSFEQTLYYSIDEQIICLLEER